MDREPRLEGRGDEVGSRMKHVRPPSQELRSSCTNRQLHSLRSGSGDSAHQGGVSDSHTGRISGVQGPQRSK